MSFMVDTDVIIDYLSKREPFFEDSAEALEDIICKGYRCYAASSAMTEYLLYHQENDRISGTGLSKDRIAGNCVWDRFGRRGLYLRSDWQR